MRNIFKNNWITKGFSSMINEESEGAEHYRHLASEFTEMAEDEEGHKAKLEEMDAKKHTTNVTQEISKPGPSIHSEKWDACVAEVSKDSGVNAYAVCTSKLGEEAFKSEMTKSELSLAKEELTKAIDITQAGQIPHSLLARQDLKGDHETTSKGKVDEAGKKLEDEAEKAEDADETEKGDIVRNITAIQRKRQKAIIEERSNKSFKDNWKKIYGR